MGWRFRRSVGLGRGLRLNFSKRGVGLSGGSRWLRMSRGADGRNRTTFTIPGTGISWQKSRRRR